MHVCVCMRSSGSHSPFVGAHNTTYVIHQATVMIYSTHTVLYIIKVETEPDTNAFLLCSTTHQKHMLVCFYACMRVSVCVYIYYVYSAAIA